MSAFATVAELSAYWRTITESETPRAEYMLDLASNRLRLIADDSDVDIDAKFEAGDPYASVVKWVTMEAVKRALSTPTDQPPVESWSQTAGPYSENYKYTNPSGDLWFKKSELSELGINGAQRLGSISTSRTDIYEPCSS